MTVLGLILGIEVAGLAFALFAARAIARRESDSAALRRLGSALERAARSFLFRQARQVGVVAAVLLAALVAPFWFATGKSVLAPLEGWVWGAFSLLSGAAVSLLVAGLSATVGVRGAVASLNVGSFRAPPGATPERTATGLAGAVYRGLGGSPAER